MRNVSRRRAKSSSQSSGTPSGASARPAPHSRPSERADGATSTPPSSFDLRTLAAIATIFVVAWLVAANGLHGAFVLDDGSKIVENTDIRRLGDLPSKLIYPYQQNQVLERNDPSRPLVFLVYGVIYHFQQLNPAAYHAVNVVFHFGCAVLVFLLTQLALLYLVGERRHLGPLAVALFFTVTPIQMGTAIYAYALNDILSSFLMLLAIYAAVRRASPSWLDVGASLLAVALALFAKQSAFVTVALILAFDFFLVPGMSWTAVRRKARLYWAHVVLVAVFLAYRLLYFGALGDMEAGGHTQPALAYALTQPVVILRYLFSTIVPVGLAIDHYLTSGSYGIGLECVSLVGLILLGAPLVVAWKRRTPTSRLILFAAAFYLVALAPTSSVLPTVDVMVERRVYLANVGVFLLVTLLWDRVLHIGFMSPTIRRAACGALAIHLALLGVVSVSRNATYATNEGVWLDVLRLYPGSERALNNLGNVYLEQKRFDKARDCFAQLVARNPKDYIAQQNLGSIYEKPDSPFHDEDKAIQYFLASVAANPDFAPGHYNLGRLYQKHAQERFDPSLLADAERSYNKTLALNPNYVLAHNNLGLIYAHTGRPSEARREYETALRLDPNCGPAKTNIRLLDSPPQGPGDARPVPEDQVPPELLLQLYEQALQKDPTNSAIRQKYEALKRQQGQRSGGQRQ